MYLRTCLSELKHFLVFNKKKPLLVRRSMREKIPGGIKKNEIIKFYSNIDKNKKITVKQVGPNGFLLSKEKN